MSMNEKDTQRCYQLLLRHVGFLVLTLAILLAPLCSQLTPAIEATRNTVFTGILLLIVMAMLALLIYYIIFLISPRSKNQYRKGKDKIEQHTFTDHDAAALAHRLQTEPSSIGDDGEIVLYDEIESNQDTGKR